MSNFREYLIALGKLNAPKEEKELLKKQYRKLYFKRYNQERQTNSKLLQIWLKTPDFNVLSEDSGKLGMKVTDFVRHLIQNYHNNSYVLPDEVVLHDLIISLTRLSTNLNQISYLCNRKKQVGYEQIHEVKQIFLKIEETTLAHFKPLHIEDYIKKEADKNPYFIEILEQIIRDYKRMGL